MPVRASGISYFPSGAGGSSSRTSRSLSHVATHNSIFLEIRPFAGPGSFSGPNAEWWEGVSAGIWRPRKIWRPLSPLYFIFTRIHRAWMRQTFAGPVKGFVPTIPLVVVGALRSGGSGKTSVTLQLARDLAVRGMRPALLVYRLGSGKRVNGKGTVTDRASDPTASSTPTSTPTPTPTASSTPFTPSAPASESDEDLIEVEADGDWRASSDEAVLLRRESGLRVFATRNRARAWRLLHEERFQAAGGFDIILSDDGFQDPRLDGAFRLLLQAPGERPWLFDLLPAGPFRETWRAASRADLRLTGPLPAEVTFPLPGKAAALHFSAGSAGLAFRRRPILPAGFDAERPWVVYCALGDNAPFLRDLAGLGVRPVAVITGRNHAAPPLKKLQAALALHPGAAVLCTRKDYLKFPADGAHPPLFPVDQELSLDPEIPDTVASWRLLSANRNLVHYPG
ncbi:MAG: tetraacyldisaccharide 4'-kinase [Fibrobacteria bacterium]